MSVDRDKLQALADSLTEDQRRLLREGLAGGDNLDVEALAASLNSAENQRILRSLSEDGGGDSPEAELFADAGGLDAGGLDAGTGNAGTVDAGTTDAGSSSSVPSEPPLTRW